MARVLTIGGVDLSGYGELLSIRAAGRAWKGESAVGTVKLYDDASTLFGAGPNDEFLWKQWSLTEDASGSTVYLERGRVGNFSTGRGAQPSKAEAQIEWTFDLEDANRELIGLAVLDENRPEETDVERVTYFAELCLQGTQRASTNLDITTYLDSANPVTMPAKRYRLMDVIEVFIECAAAADKNFFVDPAHRFHYHDDEYSGFAASIEISDGVDGAAWPDGVTYYEPNWQTGEALRWEGQDYASRIRYVYANDKWVDAFDTSSEADHDYRLVHMIDTEVVTEAEATMWATDELRTRAIGVRSYSVSLLIHATDTDKLMRGQTIWLHAKAPADSGALGRVRRLIAELQWEPITGEWYWAHLTLGQPIKKGRRPSIVGRPGPQPAPETPPVSGGTELWSVNYTDTDDSWTEACSGGAGQVGSGSGIWQKPWHGCSNMAGGRYLDSAAWSSWIPASDAELTLSLRIAKRGGSGPGDLHLDYDDGTGCISPPTNPSAIFDLGTITKGFNDVCANNSWSDKDVVFTPPAGTTMIRIRFNFDGVIQTGSLTENATTPDPDPDALDDPGDSPYYARSDDPRFDADDQHNISRLRRVLTNNSGTALTEGAVVVLDDVGFTTTSTASYVDGFVGVLVEDISADSDGYVQLLAPFTGVVPDGITGAAADDYIYTSAMPGEATAASGGRTAGAVGRILEVDGSGVPIVVEWWGVPDGASSTASDINVSHLLTAEQLPLIAHRGDVNPTDGYPECTLPGYKQAVRRGAHGVEIPFCMNADGTAYLMHDLTVNRTTTGSGNVADKTDAQMDALVIDGGFGYNAGRHASLNLAPPTREAVLDAVLPYDPIIMWDSKNTDDASHTALAEWLVANDLVERSIVLCHSLGNAQAIKAVNPNIQTTAPAGASPNVAYDRLLIEADDLDQATVDTWAPAPVDVYISMGDHYGEDEQTRIEDAWGFGYRAFLTNDLPNALTYRNELLGITAGVTDHGALTGLTDDDHSIYTRKSTLTATGDIYYATAASTPARRAIGSSGDVLTVAGGVPTWAAPAASTGGGELLISDTPSTPLVFADLIQNEAQDDLVYAD
jgi:glycerophosphoryl diester phosphodiesterase